MNDEDLYNSDLEEIFQSGKEVKISNLDSIDQIKKYEKEKDKITGINDNPNVVQYIVFKSR